MNKPQSNLFNDPHASKRFRNVAFGFLEDILRTSENSLNRKPSPNDTAQQLAWQAGYAYANEAVFTLFTKMKNALETSPTLQIVATDDIPTMERRFAQAIVIAYKELDRISATFESKARETTSNRELQEAYIDRASRVIKASRISLEVAEKIPAEWNPFPDAADMETNAPSRDLDWAEKTLPGYYQFTQKVQAYQAPVTQFLEKAGEQFVEQKRYKVTQKRTVYDLPRNTDTFEDRTAAFEQALKNNGRNFEFRDPTYEFEWTLTLIGSSVPLLGVIFKYHTKTFLTLNLGYPISRAQYGIAASGPLDKNQRREVSDICLARDVSVKTPQELPTALKKLTEQGKIGPVTRHRRGFSLVWQMKTSTGVLTLGTA